MLNKIFANRIQTYITNTMLEEEVIFIPEMHARINIYSWINVIKPWFDFIQNHMIIFNRHRKCLWLNPAWFYDESHRERRIKGTQLNTRKSVYENAAVNINLHGGKIKSILLKSEVKQILPLPIPFQHYA